LNKRTKEQFIPRHNYITLTAGRTAEGNAWDEKSNISEYQTVLAVGAHVNDIKPGDKVKFERTAFPSKDVYIDPDSEDKVKKLSEETEERLKKLDAAKGKQKDKDIKSATVAHTFTTIGMH